MIDWVGLMIVFLTVALLFSVLRMSRLNDTIKELRDMKEERKTQ